MVSLAPLFGAVTSCAPLAASVLERLDPQRRAAVILALIGLCLLGVLLVVLTMFAGRWVRRMRIHPARKLGDPPSRHKKQARPKRIPSSHPQSDTLPGLPPTGETRVDP